MSDSPEHTPRTVPSDSLGGDHDATLAQPPTAAYVPDLHAKNKLPTQFPAPFGRYQLRKLLGRGGMGAVYLAHDTQLDRPVALKIPLFSTDEESEMLTRFYREARAAATILHANVCPVYDVGEVDGVPYLTMAYIEGQSLAQWIRGKRLMPRQSAALVRKLALALQEAHKKGIIHRDLKPANIMIDTRGEPMIMDFGLARHTRPGDPRLTLQGTVMGTPAYMPPEQVKGDATAMGPACDVYSLGVILYELLTGRPPFQGDSMAILSQVLLEEPPPPSQFHPGLDAALENICLKAMAKKGADRYASMAEFVAALQGYLRSASPAPVPQPANTAQLERSDLDLPEEDTLDWSAFAEPTPEPSRTSEAEEKPAPRPIEYGRSRWVWIAGSAAIALLLGVGGFLFWLKSSSSSGSKSMPPIVREDGFVPLFNGNDLSGWETIGGDPTVWRANEGAMSFTLTDPARQRGWLVSQRDYTDFLLRFEFRLTPGARSGVGLRMWPGAPRTLMISIQDETFPAFAALEAKERTGALSGIAASPGTGVGLRSLGEWNQMEIELRGWRLRVAVNGKDTLETRLNDDSVFRYLDGAPPAGGRIGFQNGLGSVSFRSVGIKDLSGN
jgi:serine/threonine protein kinase